MVDGCGAGAAGDEDNDRKEEEEEEEEEEEDDRASSSAWSGCKKVECAAWKSDEGGVLGSEVAAASRNGNRSRRGVGVGSGAANDEDGTTACSDEAGGAKEAAADDGCEVTDEATDDVGCRRVLAAVDRPFKLTVGRRMVGKDCAAEVEEEVEEADGGACEGLVLALPLDC